MPLTLLIGGARSGKSSVAVQIGHRHWAAGSAVTHIATAPVLDEDMSDRVERHRDERPAEWATIEEEVGLGIHPESELGRRYRDLLGWVNQSWAQAANPALLLVAGRALPLTDP